ncbi:dolichyl-phosphate beta-glucosyltransferase [Nonlabens sp. Asnod2-A12]|uniref:dolichyl-phosphate beta-glucosyltransferase n=1 Tax=Nonlabens sp. Asnod2-A12 TaxID=3160578 RepID=UPI00387055AB
MKTGIIIPCYNEEKRLDQEAFVSFVSQNEDYHLCFVNDGSKDNTLDVLHKMKEQAPDAISIVDVKKNSGKATAVRAGARFLYNESYISSIGFMDADLSTDFRDFKDLVKTMKNENKIMVFGSRNSGGNSKIERNFMRNVFSKFIKQFILLILGMPIRDTQCGAKVFTRDIVPVVYQEAFLSKWLFDVEIFLRLKKHLGKDNVMKRITEQPLMRWVHVDDSKLGTKDALIIPGKLTQIWFNYNLLNTDNSVHEIYGGSFAVNNASTEYSIAA